MKLSGLFTSLAILSCISSVIAAPLLHSQVPSIGEVQQVAFAAPKGPMAAGDDYADVLRARDLFRAFDSEAPAIARYRDPILTRGPRGEAIFKSVSPAVVAVVVGSFDASEKFNPEGLGAGAIVDPRGYVLTNWHVVNGYPGGIVFLKPSGTPDLSQDKAHVATVVYQDQRVDLALLKLVDPPSSLPSLTIGDINQVQVAEDIHLIGHPHGNFWSYSTGVISQIRNDYTWKYDDGSSHESKVLQLQTAINPGNSGGPVVDDSGAILGLVAMSEEGQNLDYAIAADVIKKFLFVGMQVNSRGPQSPKPSPSPEQLYSGTFPDGRAVSKSVYPEVVLYDIRKTDATSIGLIASFKDGTVIRASNPDVNGHFTVWSAELSNGHHLAASASNGSLAEISRAGSFAR